MASTTKQRVQNRWRGLVGRLASEVGAPGRGRIEPLLTALAAAIALAAVAVALSAGAGPRSPIPKRAAQRRSIDAAVARLLGAIPENGPALGSPRAPVTLTFYGDLECSICAAFTLYGGLAPLIRSQVRSGRVRIVFRPFQTATRSPATFRLQQAAALAAGLQHRFWYYVETFYHEQGPAGSGYVTEAYLDRLARQVPGLDYARWLAQRRERSLLAQVAAAERLARSKGIQGTPTLVFHGPTGRQAQPSATIPDYDQLMQTIRRVT